MIISGGQTGVDRAALDVALELGIQRGGWCPLGREASDGRIPDKYPLKELPSGGYRKRTEWNVRDTDGTLIISTLPISGGTLLTENLTKKHNKPLYIIDINAPLINEFENWLEENDISILNVAGPSENKNPGIYDSSRKLIAKLFNFQN